MDDAEKDGEDFVKGVLTLFIFDVLVPERVGQEVKTNTLSPTVEQPGNSISYGSRARREGVQWLEKGVQYRNGVLVQASQDPSNGSMS
jgi:hypothetical protein